MVGERPVGRESINLLGVGSWAESFADTLRERGASPLEDPAQQVELLGAGAHLGGDPLWQEPGREGEVLALAKPAGKEPVTQRLLQLAEPEAHFLVRHPGGRRARRSRSDSPAHQLQCRAAARVDTELGERSNRLQAQRRLILSEFAKTVDEDRKPTFRVDHEAPFGWSGRGARWSRCGCAPR